MSTDNQARGFVRFLYTQNPFYLLSACLTLYSLHVAFRSAGAADNPWPLNRSVGRKMARVHAVCPRFVGVEVGRIGRPFTCWHFRFNLR